jgi:glycosyltransferase involved in cell wall biosynthesis
VKVVHFNTFDVEGGAARAASRLHRALRGAGCDSELVVLQKRGYDPHTRRIVPSRWSTELRTEGAAALNKALLFALRPDEAFSLDLRALAAPTAALRDAACGAVIIQLHWVRGLVSSAQLDALAAGGTPIVWTLMDLAPMTGGCHYTHGCDRYAARCGRCPRIGSRHAWDASRRTWRRRSRHYRRAPLTAVACNRWTAERARRSSLLAEVRCEIIPLAVDTGTFRPLDRRLAREVLGLPRDARLVFCGALDIGQERKGLRPLLEALGHLRHGASAASAPPISLVTAGRHDFGAREALPFPHHHLGLLGDDRSLALAYQAADIFVSPSIEDAGPMMVSEALACGTPVAAFEVGSALDLVRPGETGALAALGDAAGLARAMGELLCDPARREVLGRDARALAERELAPAPVAARYLALYRELLGRGA